MKVIFDYAFIFLGFPCMLLQWYRFCSNQIPYREHQILALAKSGVICCHLFFWWPKHDGPGLALTLVASKVSTISTTHARLALWLSWLILAQLKAQAIFTVFSLQPSRIWGSQQCSLHVFRGSPETAHILKHEQFPTRHSAGRRFHFSSQICSSTTINIT